MPSGAIPADPVTPPIEDAEGEPVYVPESALSDIASPTFLLVAANDKACPKAQAEWIEKEAAKSVI